MVVWKYGAVRFLEKQPIRYGTILVKRSTLRYRNAVLFFPYRTALFFTYSSVALVCEEYSSHNSGQRVRETLNQ